MLGGIVGLLGIKKNECCFVLKLYDRSSIDWKTEAGQVKRPVQRHVAS